MRLSERSRTFVVLGSCATQVSASLDVAGPVRAGTRHAAYTEWSVTWRLGRAGTVVGDATVDLEIETTLPRWIATRAADPALVAAWDLFVQGLAAHEAGHRAIAIEAAATVHRALAALGGRPFDADLERDARRTVDALIDAARADELHYDRETAGGATDPRIGRSFDLVAAGVPA